ncbi:hypothetical protein D1122_14870 [Cereibacter sphaeroides]|uniref:hypothetical protein n=1 Tax=Cereibacter sphaeroides TaxID=1063 RepID=UPI000E5A4D2C|nr:hypothetical protein [Cereibacter sphaeroides]RHZ95363.1 hypothetical protein D1122_14870 [Cereibacter sphaeroides]
MARAGKTPPLPPDAVRLAEAAEVVGLSAERLRQLGRAGYFEVVRGQVSLTGAIAGVIRSLRERAERDTRTAALARSQDARAALLASRTERRRERLIARADADQALEELGRRAISHLQSVPVGGVAAYLREPLAAEILVATKAIMKATAKARGALSTGDMSEVE